MMTNSQFQSELMYQLILLYAQDILKRGWISKTDYLEFQQKMIALYQPFLSKYMDETLDKLGVLSDI